MVVSRVGVRAAAETQNLLYYTAKKHKEPVEEHCSALRQLVSISTRAFDKIIDLNVWDDMSQINVTRHGGGD